MENLNLFLEPKAEVAVLPIENKTILNSTKSELSEMASLMVQAVDDGMADALDTLIIAKKGMYVFESISDAMKNKVPTPEKEHFKFNCSVTERATGVKYYFDGCNDEIWNDLNIQFLEIKDKIKQRESWLKTFTKPTEIEDQIDEETGEVIMSARKINPPVKTGGVSTIISIK